MDFCIADTFTASLAKLTAQEQKAAKTTAFDLQVDPSSPGMQFHRLDKPKDPNFWSVRVSLDLRIIVHKTASSLLLCYVGHHDEAYAWAERRKIETHPRTGAAQLVEVRERVEEHVIQRKVAAKGTAPRALFAAVPDDTLLGYGVPAEWLEDVKQATEEGLFDLAEHLPQEAAEALLDLATGVTPRATSAAASDGDPFQHPDAQRRFRFMDNVAELERALEYPWEKWSVFLHPSQRQYVEKDYNGPARISGSAGTGKTIVALHRAVVLARRHPSARVLVTTFSKELGNALATRLQRLAGNEPAVAGRIEVRHLKGIGYDLYAGAFGQPNIASEAVVRSALKAACESLAEHRFSERFLWSEWNDVVDAWQVKTWDAYRDVARLGRKTRISGKQRESLWAVFAAVRADLEKRKAVTWPDLFGSLSARYEALGGHPYDYVVVDEAQDVAVPELRFLATLGGARRDGLFFTGDLGQRIFQQAFSWKALGVDVRGRSHTLRINYRTSHQIRSHADRLLPSLLADVDGNVESRKGTVSIFNGPAPDVLTFDDEAKETASVGAWISARLAEGILPQEIGVFVREHAQRKRAKAAVKAAGASPIDLGEDVATVAGKVAVGTMHLAKGLEFRAVVVMACDDEVLPLQERIESVADDSDLEEVYNTERHLLYVACTRARDRLMVSGVAPGSEFLGDMSGA